MLARLRPSVFCTTVFSGGAASLLGVSAACFSPSSRRPSFTMRLSSLPFRTMTTSTSLPTGVSATMRGRSFISLMSLPSNLMMTSPASMPAGFAGPFSSMPATSAPRRLDVEAVGDIVGDLLDAHAKPAAARLAELAELVDNRNRGLGRHREPDADRAARRRDDRGVDSDDLAFEIEQRTARIAPIDGGVGLDVIVIRARIDVAVARRHDASRHGTAKDRK